MAALFRFCILFIFTAVSSVSFADKNISLKFQAGRDYLVLPVQLSPEKKPALKQNLKNPPKITVTEFFSYGCPACFKLEPALENWLSHQSSRIVFKRMPVSFEPGWENYAKSYEVISQLNLDYKLTLLIFEAVHNNNLDLTDKNIMAGFLNQYGVGRQEFLTRFDSAGVNDALSQNKKIIHKLMVFQVPAIIINQKYQVDPSLAGGNNTRLLAIADYLINNAANHK